MSRILNRTIDIFLQNVIRFTRLIIIFCLIKKDLRNLKEICIESNFSNLCSYEETLNSVEHLIQYLVNWFSQELIIIFEFIELYNIIDEDLELFKIMHNMPKNREEVSAANICDHYLRLARGNAFTLSTYLLPRLRNRNSSFSSSL